MAAAAVYRVVDALDLLTGRPSKRATRQVMSRTAAIASLTNDDLFEAMQRMINRPKLAPDAAVGKRAFAGWRRRGVARLDVDAVAYAAEAFTRFPPAGVERGSRLYQEQVLAAFELMSNGIVQMDTGEGKTYA